MISSSSLILRPPKVRRWKYFIGICGGVVRSLERELRAPPWGPRPGPSGEGWLQLGEGAGGAASPHREAEGGRAAAGPARKEKLLPAEATHGPARLRGALSPRDRRAQACISGGGGPGTPTSLRDSSRNGHSRGPGGARDSHSSALTPFRSAKRNFRAGQGFSEP